jgi:hypothetical protein
MISFDDHPFVYQDVTYRAVCKCVLDVDTIGAIIDLGFYTYIYSVLKIKDISIPNLDVESCKAIIELYILNKPIVIKMYTDGYCDIYYYNNKFDIVNIKDKFVCDK